MTLAWNEKLIGKKVRVEADGKVSGVRKVVGLLLYEKGGVVLDKQVRGFRCWNVRDLRRERT